MLFTVAKCFTALFLIKLAPIVVHCVKPGVFGYKVNNNISSAIEIATMHILNNLTGTEGIETAYFFIRYLYSGILLILTETFDLLRNRCYNKRKQRYETIYLETEQIVIAVLLYIINSFFMMNVLIYYIVFVAFKLSLDLFSHDFVLQNRIICQVFAGQYK